MIQTLLTCLGVVLLFGMQKLRYFVVVTICLEGINFGHRGAPDVSEVVMAVGFVKSWL